MSDSLTAGELKEIAEEITIDVLHEVQKWLSGEQSKEKLAERLELDFDTLNTFLPSDRPQDTIKELIEEIERVAIIWIAGGGDSTGFEYTYRQILAEIKRQEVNQ